MYHIDSFCVAYSIESSGLSCYQIAALKHRYKKWHRLAIAYIIIFISLKYI